MGLFSKIQKVFGYDRKGHNRNINAHMWARDAAYKDSYKIEEASRLMLSQIPGIQAHAGYLHQQAGMLDAAAGAMDEAGRKMQEQAGLVRKAGDKAKILGARNAANIMTEVGEWVRRREGEQKTQQGGHRARAAASGIVLDTGGSSDIFQTHVKTEHGKEIKHGKKTGRSQAEIAREEGVIAKEQAYATAKGVDAQADSAFSQANATRGQAAGVRGQAEAVMAQIPAVQSQAKLYEVQASQLRSNSDLAYQSAKKAKSASKYGAYFAMVTTAISAGSFASSMGWIGGASSSGAAAGGTGMSFAGAGGAWGQGAGVAASKAASGGVLPKLLAGAGALMGLSAITQNKNTGSGLKAEQLYDRVDVGEKVNQPDAIQVKDVQAPNMPEIRGLDTTTMPEKKNFIVPTLTQGAGQQGLGVGGSNPLALAAIQAQASGNPYSLRDPLGR